MMFFRPIGILLAGLAGAAGTLPVLAQGLADPTRPPAILDVPGAADAGGQGLQAIIRRGGGAKPVAVIAGQHVELGGKVGDARLVRVGEDRVELRGSAGTEVLLLTPTVKKEMPVPVQEAKGHKGVQAKTKDRAGK